MRSFLNINLLVRLSVVSIFFFPLMAGWAGTQQKSPAVERPPANGVDSNPVPGLEPVADVEKQGFIGSNCLQGHGGKPGDLLGRLPGEQAGLDFN